MYRPAKSKQGSQKGTLPNAHNWRHRNKVVRSSFVLNLSCEAGFLACATWGTEFLPYHVQHAIWKIQVVKDAIISSAPEIFQWRMHQLVEGLQGIEVMADDFVI